MKQKRAAAAAGITNALERERTATAAGLAYVFEQHCGARHFGFPATRLADALEQEHVAVELSAFQTLVFHTSRRFTPKFIV